MQHNPKMTLRQVSLATLMALTVSFSAVAEEETLPEYTFMDAVKGGKNLTSFRLRYEHVDQDGFQPGTKVGIEPNPTATEQLKNANALTLRSLVGWQTAPYKNFSFGVQLTNVSKLDDDFNDGTNNTLINAPSNQPRNVEYAKVVDPSDTDINQLFVDWTGIKNTKIRLGRQQVNLDNVRFIGDIAFRQVMQVFDGVSLVNKSIPDTEVFLAHFERVKQITTESRGDGAIDIANVRYRISPTEFLVGYGYLDGFENLGFGRAWFGNAGNTALARAANKVGDVNEFADQGNKILGLRLDGVHPFNPNLRALYTAEYAKQDDYNGGDDRIDAHYYKLGGGFGYDNFSLRVDQELLSSNDGKYAFQTPLGTNHLFQGWVDKFLVTPAEGMRDTFVTATYKWGDVLFFADYHVFHSDENFHTVGNGLNNMGNRFGKEWNAAATYNYDKNIMAKIEYGRFTEDDHYALLPSVLPASPTPVQVANANRGRFRDTEKLWLTVMYSF